MFGILRKDKLMNKENIYEEFFNVIRESIEWGIDAKNSKYGNYIDGVASMAQILLDKLDELEDKKED